MNLPNSGQTANNKPPPVSLESLDRRREAKERERLMWAILYEWRKAGRYQYSDADLQAEIDRRIARLREVVNSKKQTLIPFEPASDEFSLQNRYDSFTATRELRGTRARQILELLEKAGRRGHTRQELAKILGCHPSDLCSPVNELRASKQVLQTAERRSVSNRPGGTVIILPKFAEGPQ